MLQVCLLGCCETIHFLYVIMIERLFLSHFDTFKGFGLGKFLFRMSKDSELVLQDESEVGDNAYLLPPADF